jgi:hypothetical protein
MKVNATIPKRNIKEQEIYDRQQVEKFSRWAAIVFSFVTVFYFFFKLLFL